MRVLLDTTYFLPAAGIAVREVERDALRKISGAGHEISLSDISLFEMLAKGARLAAQGLADADRVLLAVRSIREDDEYRKVSAYEGGAAEVAIGLRKHHQDFIDCLILGSALDSCEALVTEDEEMVANEGVMKEVRRLNPEFRILSFRRLPSR